MGREAQLISLQPRCLQACSKQGEEGAQTAPNDEGVLLQLVEEPWVTAGWVLPRALRGPEP